VTDGPRTYAPESHPVLTDRPASDGRFRYTSVPPGRYTILARAESDDPGRPSFGVAEIEVFEQDSLAVSLTLRHGIAVAGRVRFASLSAHPPDVTTAEVNLNVPGGAYMSSYVDGTVTGTALISPRRSNPAADGTFSVQGVAPWTYAFQASLPAGTAETWWLRSAMLDGRDLLDEPLIVGSDDISGVELTFTDQQNVLSGSLQTAGGAAASQCYIVVTPADGRPWRERSRRFAVVRPASNGQFKLTGLPAGDYLLAALADFETDDFGDSSLLAQLAAQSVKVTIMDGQETVQAIRLVQ